MTDNESTGRELTEAERHARELAELEAELAEPAQRAEVEPLARREAEHLIDAARVRAERRALEARYRNRVHRWRELRAALGLPTSGIVDFQDGSSRAAPKADAGPQLLSGPRLVREALVELAPGEDPDVRGFVNRIGLQLDAKSYLPASGMGAGPREPRG